MLRISSVRIATLAVLLLVFPACGDDSGKGADDADTGASTDVTDADDAGDGSGEDAPETDLDDTGDDAPPDAPEDTGEGSGDDVLEDAPDTDDEPDTRPAECPDPPRFSYACEGSDPSTCPSGFCLFGQCIAPVVDANRWDDCGDGTCDDCESDTLCPADCSATPTLDRPRDYDNDTTITIEVHGFNPVDGGEWDETVYGAIDGTSGGGRLIRTYAPDIPDGTANTAAPNQMIGVEYYGAIPADWLSEEDIAEIEANDWRTDRALHRYALVVGKFINWYAAEVGATDVNLYCHSMGCHVTRYMLERDIEGVASSGMVARWTTHAGVIAGARLARLFDNPIVQDAAELLQLNTADFIHMNPDYVEDHSAWWDHDIHAANNPLLSGILIHHLAATDPTLEETFNLVPLLDLSNPDDEPNDGLVYTWDEMFRTQPEALQHETPSGDRVSPTATYQNVDHFMIKEQAATGILTAAALYHRRKVWVELESISLRNDLEQDSVVDFSQNGTPPADISYKIRVSYDPYIADTFGGTGHVHDRGPEDRSTPLIQLVEGRSTSMDWILFEGPVFDDQESIRVNFELLEMDQYPRFGITEWAFDIHERLIGFNGDLPLENEVYIWENDNVRIEVRVTVRDMY